MRSVLVVDDCPDVRGVLERKLAQCGDRVTAVGDGARALDAALSQSFDIAIVDYELPITNGLDVLAALRNIQPNCVRILVSGALDVPAALDAVNRGEVARALPKPFDCDALDEAIEQALAMRKRVAEDYASANQRDHVDEGVHLRECLDNDLIRLALQPIVTASEHRIVAYEALLRSSHDSLDGPLPVLQAAERHGLLAILASRVAKLAARWMSRLPSAAKLFVNLHPAELADPTGLASRLQVLAPWAERLVLEITERSRITDADAWRESVRVAAGMGFAIAVDDLGAGYSSLSMLAALKPQYIKIDMSIVRALDQDAHKRSLVELLCTFGRATGAPVIAEGVEREAEGHAVAAAGADLVQGYLYGRPQLEAVPGLTNRAELSLPDRARRARR